MSTHSDFMYTYKKIDLMHGTHMTMKALFSCILTDCLLADMSVLLTQSYFTTE